MRTGELATMVWPFDSKNFRKVWRMSVAFIGTLVEEVGRRSISAESQRRLARLEPGPPRI
jgi:hypothetical protein